MKSGHLAKVPFIEQMHQTECGICCLAMILEYYHSKESLARIREELEIGRDGLKLSQLYAYAKKRNMDAKVFSADFEALQKMPLPAIAFWNQEHYIVIERIKKKEVVIVDPAIGRICMSHEDFVNGYSKVVMVLMPEENFDKRCEKGHLWGDVIKKVIWKNNLFLKTALITFLTYALQLTISLIVCVCCSGNCCNLWYHDVYSKKKLDSPPNGGGSPFDKRDIFKNVKIALSVL